VIKVTLIKPHGKYDIGKVLEVERNDGHTLIEQGVAILGRHRIPSYQSKEMSAKPKSRYRTKGRG